jgi:hypothetical protein
MDNGILILAGKFLNDNINIIFLGSIFSSLSMEYAQYKTFLLS